MIELDCDLITALVERWRPETHTFHFTVGESTVTLQDVGVLTGLPIHGMPVTGNAKHDWTDVCERLLGAVPPRNAFEGSKIKLTWLSQRFHTLPADATDVEIQYYTRAWLLRCLGGLVFTTNKSNMVHLMFLPLLEDFNVVGQYSWGSACLAWLYRELCRATRPNARGLGGYLQLLQIWAWERLPNFRPNFINRVSLHQDMPYGYRLMLIK